MANKYGIKYYECSCLNGLNVYEILNELILSGYNAYYEKKCKYERISKDSLKLKDIDSINDNTNYNSGCYYGKNKKSDINKIIKNDDNLNNNKEKKENIINNILIEEKNKKEIKKINENAIFQNSNLKNIEKIPNDNNKKEFNKLKEELIDLKSRFPFELNKEEKILIIIIISFDENIYFSTICKNTENISRAAKLFYEKYPQFSKTNNIFTVRGNVIDKNKTLEENKIKDNDIIIIKPNKI